MPLLKRKEAPIHYKHPGYTSSFEHTHEPHKHTIKGADEKSGGILSTIGILLLALFFSLFIISFVFRSYAVDGNSMQPTLQNSDKLIIWKVPRTLARISGNAYIPNRGDVIVFDQDVTACGSTGSKQLIKRVVGLPGDRVVIANNAITIYNTANPTGFQPDKTLPYGGHIQSTSGNVDLKLPAGQIFVAGDNRPDSCDSRFFGPVKADYIIGKLAVRVLPITGAKLF
jgi:signal peptidase I